MPEPTILSPYGEGYCRYCRFIIGLGPDGLLERHFRGRHSRDRFGDELKACKGSDRRPAPASRVPYWARKSRFRYEAPVARCPKCKQDAKVTTFNGSDTYYFLRHHARFEMCSETGNRVEQGITIR
jgi:hypothetical protein